MPTSNIIYLGELRTQATHTKSNTVIITDAPTDNHGKGKAFSPTDLVATALASCMQTIIGLLVEQNRIPKIEMNAEVTKIMESNPRRISEIHINFNIKGSGLTEENKRLLQHAALHCPVALSLNSEIKQVIVFNYGE